MLTLLSTLISFLMGGLPKILEFFQGQQDKKHELALASYKFNVSLRCANLGLKRRNV